MLLKLILPEYYVCVEIDQRCYQKAIWGISVFPFSFPDHLVSSAKMASSVLNHTSTKIGEA